MLVDPVHTRLCAEPVENFSAAKHGLVIGRHICLIIQPHFTLPFHPGCPGQVESKTLGPWVGHVGWRS